MPDDLMCDICHFTYINIDTIIYETKGGKMITFKEYVFDNFTNHDQAIKFLGFSHATFYRKLKDDRCLVFFTKDEDGKEKHHIVNSILSVREF